MKNITLFQKLTLLVLALIFGCLVLLVVRAYQSPIPNHGMTRVAESSSSVEAEPTISLPAPAPSSSPVRRPVAVQPNHTNRLAIDAPTISAAVTEPSTETAPNLPKESAPGGIPAFAEFERVSGVAKGNSANDPGTQLAGFVTLLGTPEPEVPITVEATCGRVVHEQITTRHYVVGERGGLANVFVFLRDAKPTPTTAEGPVLDQVGCLFEPYVMGVVTGQPFTIRNSDPILHNVHATPRQNREFNLGQPHQGEVTKRTFSQPEVFVRLKCEVHGWMFAYIGVVDHPYFAVSDTNGFFSFPAGLPTGTYMVMAVHPKGGMLSQRVQLEKGQRKAIQFQLPLPPAGSQLAERFVGK